MEAGFEDVEIKFSCYPTGIAIPESYLEVIPDMIAAGRRLCQAIPPPTEFKSAGNLSVRAGEQGCLITRTHSRLDQLTECDFSLIDRWLLESFEVWVSGGVIPSTESFTHLLAYDEDARAKAIAHNHDSLVIAKARNINLPLTREMRSYGDRETAEEVRKNLKRAMANGGCLGVPGHGEKGELGGLFAFASTIKEAADIIVGFHKRALRA